MFDPREKTRYNSVMRRLVCAATWGEMRAYGDVPDEQEFSGRVVRRGEEGFLVSGVGIPCALATVLEAARRERPAHILNLGIAGAYPGTGLDIGDIVIGDSEVYGDIGFELPDPPGFQAAREATFGGFYRPPLPLAPWATASAGTSRGRGCTVNCCAGTLATGQRRAELFEAAFETMEGAAVAQAGAMLGIPVSEARAISNIAARRDMRPENIRRALDNLSAFFAQCREDAGA